ncbi:MAG: PepSY-associated TM helix domain-containing protein [Minwuia sp.]|nr:PepSY-associated TM helix domain-containing protein [Minwuia sp.]
MRSLSQGQLKRLNAIHGWSGTLLGLLLYAVIVTGTMVVFAHEIAVWSMGGARGPTHLTPGIDEPVRTALRPITKGYLEEVLIATTPRGDLTVFPHTHAKHPETGEIAELGTVFVLDRQTGDVTSRSDGFVVDEPQSFGESALEHFLVDLHVQLYLPAPWGRILTGLLGLAIMGAGVTGLIIHRHVLRDLFVAERPGGRLASARDRHVLAGSWALPFAFLLGFTGAFFSFAGSVGFPILTKVAFGGDQEAMLRTLVDQPATHDERKAPVADLNAVIADSEARAGTPVSLMTIANYGQANAEIRTFHEAPAGQLHRMQIRYGGVDGAFIKVAPIVGKQPSLGADLVGLMFPLHFGHFAGPLSKSAWVGLGTTLAFVVVAGMRLWVRRREGSRMWRRFGRAVTVTSYGLPLAMLTSAYAFFLTHAALDAFWWTPAGFVIGAAGAVALGLVLGDDMRLRRLLGTGIAFGCLALPFVRMATGGTAWAEALSRGYGTVLAIDLVLLALGLGLLFWSRQVRVARTALMQGAAE